jgi:bromodomain adjacent to zinc finger domain protein 1A
MNALVGDVKEEEGPVPSEAEEEVPVQDSSDLSDVSPSEGGSETASAASRPKGSARQKDLRIKAQNQAHAKQRELARAKVALQKQAVADHRRLDEEVNKLERRLESIEREFRKLLGAVRVKPLGKDRFHNRIWWFDGTGSASLLGSGGVVQYGTGRLFIQGPSEFDAELLERRDDEDIAARRKEEEGEDGILAVGDWAVYTELEEVILPAQVRKANG